MTSLAKCLGLVLRSLFLRRESVNFFENILVGFMEGTGLEMS